MSQRWPILPTEALSLVFITPFGKLAVTRTAAALNKNYLSGGQERSPRAEPCADL